MWMPAAWGTHSTPGNTAGHQWLLRHAPGGLTDVMSMVSMLMNNVNPTLGFARALTTTLEGAAATAASAVGVRVIYGAALCSGSWDGDADAADGEGDDDR